MNLAWYIYLCDVVENISELFKIMSFFSVFVVAINLIVLFIFFEFKDDRRKVLKMFLFMIPIAVTLSFMSAIIPKKNTMYAMAAAYYGEKAVKSEEFQRLNSKALKLIEVKIDDLLQQSERK